MISLKALIIDDNPNDRTLALRELKKLFPGLEYWEINDEAGFAKALQENKFNLVITDYQLRWTTGLDILYCIKKQRAECPVIMFTGTGSEEIAVKAMKAGLDDYVIKSPTHYLRLAVAVKLAWQRSQQQQALEEIKQSYDRFFEQVPLGLYRLNSKAEILEANSTLVKIFGYSHQQDLLGKNIITHHVETETYRQWQQQLQQVDAIAEFETQIQQSNGKFIWVRHNAIALKDREGNLIGYEGAITDITANKEAELERIRLLNRERKARQEAEALNRLKDEFLATLSHELRTPLNSIMGWIQLLRGGKMDGFQLNKALEIIDRNAKAQNQLVEDLLDVSRIIRGTMKLELKSVDLIEVILNSLDTILPTAKAKDIQLVTQLGSQSILVNGDAEKLQQVFWNLVINAVKYTPTNGKVIISTEIKENTVFVKVEDKGKGIAAEVLPYIFDRFRQAETKSSTRTQGGLGLGLAIVRHLVEIHGGKVIAESEGIGKGATFTVELPLLKSIEDYQQEIIQLFNSKALPSLKGLTLLVVEDEADAREMLTLMLEEYGAKVITADSVRQALVKYEKQKPDILISDISMPKEDGYSLIQQIRSSQDSENYLPAIALTAYAREEDLQKAKNAGFDLHLAKPVELVQLVKSLAQLAAEKLIR